LAKAFASVYADGYRAGYKDGKEDILVNLQEGKTEYVDLGLSSGTLWAADYEKVTDGKTAYYAYCEAKELNIPTIEQWTELRNSCRWLIENNIFYCIGPNGKTISFSTMGFIILHDIITSPNVRFWVDNKDEKEIRTPEISRDPYGCVNFKFPEFFPGYKLPVRLVKSK
jgi:hypothetical protein